MLPRYLPELMVVAGEDIAAVLGLAVAIIAVMMTVITGESAAPETLAAIKTHFEVRAEGQSVIGLIMLQWGEQLMIEVQAKMQSQAKWCFFEPDFEDAKD